MPRRPTDAPQSAGAIPPLRLPRYALIALVTLALLGVALLLHPVGDYHAESDFYGGYRAGALMLRHALPDPARYGVVGPLYEALLALLGSAGGDLYTIAKLLSVASACAALIAWSGMLTVAAGELAGLWMVALLAVNPTFARYGYSAATDMPALALESLALLFLIRAGDPARPGDRVMSRKGHIGYYSGLEVVPFPRFSTLTELAEEARGSHARFLYYSWYEAQLRSEFSWLLDTTATVPGLELVAFTRDKASALYRMGPDFGRDPDWLSDSWLTRLHEARALVGVLPDSLTAPYRLALAEDALERGAPQVALDLADHAGRFRPREPVVWMTRGRALLDLSRPEDAAESFARAVQLDSLDAGARRALGIALAGAGKLNEAARAWRGLVADTDDPELLKAMERAFTAAGEAAAADSARARRHGAGR